MARSTARTDGARVPRGGTSRRSTKVASAQFDDTIRNELMRARDACAVVPGPLHTGVNFRRLIEREELAPLILDAVNAYLARKGMMVKRGTMVDATIIAAPSSTKNSSGKRDLEMHQTKKGNNWYFGMKAHIGADTDSGLVHTVVTTPANESDVEQVDQLLHGKEKTVHADAGYTGAEQRVGRRKIEWKIARRRSQVKKIASEHASDLVVLEEKRKAGQTAKKAPSAA